MKLLATVTDRRAAKPISPVQNRCALTLRNVFAEQHLHAARL